MEQVKFGIIGCGGMGTHHAKTIHAMEGANLVGVADMIGEKATALANELGTEAHTDFHELLPHVDGVMVCTPPFERVDVVIGCAKAGVHIFAEKPIALDLATADQMLAATDRAKVAGARIGQGPTEIPPGTFTFIEDPDGNTIGLFQGRAA